MDGITIILIVLPLILLILILGLIFNKAFREDILKTDGQNEVGFKGISLKGSLFWVLYAATAAGAIYLGMKQTGASTGVFAGAKPELASALDFVAIDMEKLEPVELEVTCEGCDTIRLGRKPSKLELDLILDSLFTIRSRKSNFLLGRLDRASVEMLSGFKELNLKQYIEIKYDIRPSPFSTSIDPSYNWAEYGSLPFTVEVHFDQVNQTHAVISNKGNSSGINIVRSLDSKWAEAIEIGGRVFVVKLRGSKVISKPKGSFANFVILELEGKK